MTVGPRIAAEPWTCWLSTSRQGTCGSAIRIASGPAPISPFLAARVVTVGGHRLRLEWLRLEWLRRRHGLVPDLIGRLPLVPDLTRRLSVMPDLARRLTTGRVGTDRLSADRLGPDWLSPDRLGPQWLWPAVAVGDDWCDWTSDPERAEPLLGLDITRVAGHVVAELTRLGVLTVIADRVLAPRLALSRLPPASAPPGHS